MKNFLIFSCLNRVDFFYLSSIPGSANRFLRCGSAAEFAMADDGNRSVAAPAIDGNRSSAESIYAGGAAGSWRRIRRTTATAGTGAAAIPHAMDRAVRSAFGGAHVAMRKRRRRSSRRRGRTFSAARQAANHLAHAGTRIPIYWNDYFDRRGNSVARRPQRAW